MFFRKKEKPVNQREVVNGLLAYILSKDSLSIPHYMEEVKSEADAEKLGIAPVAYIWNENREAGLFNVSINGKAIAHLLEAIVPRDHSDFRSIRDEVMRALAASSRATVVKTCQSTGKFPSELFKLSTQQLD
jgi:hypothetical protein